jgi:hypothetical protein
MTLKRAVYQWEREIVTLKKVVFSERGKEGSGIT